MIVTIKQISMNKKQTYIAPEVVSQVFYPRESVLNITSETNNVLTISATSIIGKENDYEGVDW